MSKDQMEKYDPPTYEDATTGSLPPPLYQSSMVSPKHQAAQAPDHFDDSLFTQPGLFPFLSMQSLTVGSTKSAMPNDRTEKDAPPTYEEVMTGCLPPDLLQPSIITPKDKALQEPDRRQTGAYHIPYSHFDDSLLSPGLLPLLSMHSLTVSSTNSACVFNIKDISKELVFTAKVSAEGNCCNCFQPRVSWTDMTIKTIDRQPLAMCRVNVDEITCCSEPEVSIVVSFPNARVIGAVTINDYHHFVITNPSGDVVLTVHGKSSFWLSRPFKIFARDGNHIGSIERTEGVKNKLSFPRDLDIRFKILLLVTAIHIQEAEERRRRGD